MIKKRIVCILILTILSVSGTQHIPSASDIPDSMVRIPAGEFEMGSDTGNNNERPVHTVYLDAFYMDIYEADIYQSYCPTAEGVASARVVL